MVSLGNTKDNPNQYSNWGSCSKKCGGGKQSRTNSCALVTSDLVQDCNTMGCSSKINYGNWSGWSKCSASCGGGTQSRSRSKTSAYDGSSCGTESQSQKCNTQSCCSESNPSGCPKMYVCKGSTYFHEYPQYSTGSQTLLPWAKVSVLGKSGEFTKVYVDHSQPHAGKWNRYSVGYIKTECLVT